MISKCTEEAYVGSNIYAFSYSFGYQISTSFQFWIYLSVKDHKNDF